jgi:hypothetical protein
MVLPLGLPAIGKGLAAAAPHVLGLIGGMLPFLLNKSKTPEEVEEILRPEIKEAVDRLVGSGVPREAAGEMVMQQMESRARELGAPEPMLGMIPSLILSAIGGIGGYAAGGRLAAKYGAKAAAGAGAGAAKTAASTTPDLPRIGYDPASPQPRRPSAPTPTPSAAAVDAPFPRATPDPARRELIVWDPPTPAPGPDIDAPFPEPPSALDRRNRVRNRYPEP